MFKRVLIANRGEIAIRVARAAAALGVESVGVYAPVDALSLHTRVTTIAKEIPARSDQRNSGGAGRGREESGGAARRESGGAARGGEESGGRFHTNGNGGDAGGASADPVRAYLDIDALISIAKETGCDCVHPGYGFLAENTHFAKACAEAGLVFIGPRADTLELFGDKTRARKHAQALGIPVVPGTPPLQFANLRDEIRAAESIGFPVMIKAAAGGGGRGMRRVDSVQEFPEAFARCESEARAAFGDGTLFIEKLIARPRHIEVQILGDAAGTVVHLWERDCSIQQRNQKVIEIAPAPYLDAQLVDRILNDAVKLARATKIENAATLEFLVVPEKGERYFIEGNPRIQVEHTVTEQVTGIDLVEAQFRIASGETLADLGLGFQSSVHRPHGFAIQARITALGPGTITSYKEPGGPGVRVDSCGYAGLSPPPQFDPMFAKLIVTSGRAHSFAAALEKTVRALDEFHIAGLPTNLSQLRALLTHPAVKKGDARTTLIAEHEELQPKAKGTIESAPLKLFEAAAKSPSASRASHAQHLPPLLRNGGGQRGAFPPPFAQRMEGGGSPRSGETVGDFREPLEVADGDIGIEAPLTGTIVSVEVKAGDVVNAGDTVLIVSAMKMETAVTAPSAGTIAQVQTLSAGDQVFEGEVLVTLTASEAPIRPSSLAERASGDTFPASGKGKRDPGWSEVLSQVQTLRDIAHDRFNKDSKDPGVVRQRSRGKLTAYERIDLLFDKGSFREVGSAAGFASYNDDGQIAEFTPANHIGGWGAIEGRRGIVCADDFTSRGGHADGAISSKSRYLDQLSLDFKCPSVRLLDGSSGGGSVAAMVPKQAKEGESTARESSGAITAGRPRVTGGGGSFLPGHLGSVMYAEQLAQVPVVNVLLGSVVGIGAAKAVLGHFSVMVKDIAQLFVAGPPVVSHAMGYDVSKEDLGDWRIHCRNGSVDNLAETEEEAMAQTKRFLSYLPASVFEAPPVSAPRTSDPPDRREEELFTIIPRKRTTTFDMRRAIRLMADRDSFFEIGPLWGTDQIVGFLRMNGYPMGVLASDSRHVNGGALTADGCDKLRRHIDVCDVFHLPMLNLIDNPGFAVGVEHEMTGTIRKGGEWMIAAAQAQVPLFTVIMRRSFGVAGNNYATPLDHASARVAWPAADVGGIPPEGGIEAAYKRQLAEAKDPKALRAEIEARIESARGPVGPLNRFQMEEMIDPRDTRKLVCEWVENAYRIVRQPQRLGPRALGFRP